MCCNKDCGSCYHNGLCDVQDVYEHEGYFDNNNDEYGE